MEDIMENQRKENLPTIILGNVLVCLIEVSLQDFVCIEMMILRGCILHLNCPNVDT
jgi:hypothetical protein